MKKHLIIIAFLILSKPLSSYCQTLPQVSVIGSSIKDFEYKCYTPESNYSIELPIFNISNLEYNEIYNYFLTLYDPKAFGTATYETYPAFEPYGSYFKWVQQNKSTAEVDITFGGSYSTLELYSWEGMRFSINKQPYPSWGDTATASLHVVTPMYISGSKLVCCYPTSFYLNAMPTYSSATWEIKQGSTTKCSGSGTTASASNLSNGNGVVIFTVNFVVIFKV